MSSYFVIESWSGVIHLDSSVSPVQIDSQLGETYQNQLISKSRRMLTDFFHVVE